MKIDTNKMLVINGMIFTLVTKEEVYTNEPENYVCKLCELHNTCSKFEGQLCDIQDALPNQFYVFIDRIEVVSLQIANGILGSYEKHSTQQPNKPTHPPI